MAFLSGTNLISDVVSIIGVLVFCSGLHLLWQSRREIFGWIEEYFRLFRMSMKQVAEPAHAPLELPERRVERKHAVRIALGFVLAFLVAPMLITLGLAF